MGCFFWGWYQRFIRFAARGHHESPVVLEVLENNLLPFIEKTKQKFPGKSVIFMQDGARYHWHKDVKEWFLNHDIEIMIWPPQSPDLNPIEHIWGNMKKELSMKNPYVTSYVEMTFICQIYGLI